MRVVKCQAMVFFYIYTVDLSEILKCEDCLLLDGCTNWTQGLLALKQKMEM